MCAANIFNILLFFTMIFKFHLFIESFPSPACKLYNIRHVGGGGVESGVPRTNSVRFASSIMGPASGANERPSR